MGTGAITQYIDVAQIVLYLFWAFFAGLIVLAMLAVPLSRMPLIGFVASAVLVYAFALGWFVLWFMLLVKTFQRQEFVIPLLGSWARKRA